MAEEPSLRDLKKTGLELNKLFGLEPGIDLSQEEDGLKKDLLKAIALWEDGDKVSEESTSTLKALGWEEPTPKKRKKVEKEDDEGGGEDDGDDGDDEGDDDKEVENEDKEDEDKAEEDKAEEERPKKKSREKEEKVAKEATAKKDKGKKEANKTTKRQPPKREAVEVPKGYLEIADAVKKSGKSKRTVRVAGREGEIKVKKEGGRVFYEEKSLVSHFSKKDKD